MFFKVRPSNVRFRAPYFVRCVDCGCEIKGYDSEEVARYANERGWKYDYKNDVVICNECLEKRAEKES